MIFGTFDVSKYNYLISIDLQCQVKPLMLLQMFNDYSSVLVHSKLFEEDTPAAVLSVEDHFISLEWSAFGDSMSYIFFSYLL